MSKPLKVGDLLYTVYEGDFDDRLVIKTAEIASVGAKSVKISGRAGLAFDCRSQFTIGEIERRRFGRTEREAWEKYADQMGEAIDQGERNLVRLRRNYHFAIEQAKR